MSSVSGPTSYALLSCGAESRYSKRGVQPWNRACRVDIHQILEKSFILFGEQLKDEDIVIKKIYAQQLPTTLGSSNHLEQVFINLINNAQDALQNVNPGLITIKTEVRRQEEKSPEVVVSFTDNGEGIPSSIINQVFDPFFYNERGGKGNGPWPVYQLWDHPGASRNDHGFQ